MNNNGDFPINDERTRAEQSRTATTNTGSHSKVHHPSTNQEYNGELFHNSGFIDSFYTP